MALLRLQADALNEREAIVDDLTCRGMSTRAIAAQLGVSPATVVRIRKRLGISRASAQRMTLDEVCRGQAMINDGAPLTEVARTLGRDLRTISAKFPNAPRVSRPDRARLAQMSKQFSELGKKAGRDGFAPS